MMITSGQFIVAFIVIIGIFLISFLVTRYTKYGGGSNYGADKDGGEHSPNNWDGSNIDMDL